MTNQNGKLKPQKVSVYIGRFQPLHKGHTSILNKMFESEDDLGVILIGSSFQARTIKNPFTFGERAEMIKGYLKSIGVSEDRYQIWALRDQPYNDSKWIQSVQEHVETALGIFNEQAFFDAQIEQKNPIIQMGREREVVLVGSDRDSSTWYLKAFPQFKLGLSEPAPIGRSLNATGVRAEMFSSPHDKYLVLGHKAVPSFWDDLPSSSQQFILKFVGTKEHKVLCDEFAFIEKYKQSWKAAPYEPIFSTVDAVVIQSGHVLAIQRGALPGKGLWALPGGFVGQRDRLEQAAIRELIEETGIKVPEQVLKGSIKAKEIFDAPDRSLRGRTISTAFLIRLDDTKPLPKVKGQNAPLHETGGIPVVETLKAKWIPISEARANSAMWFDDHHAIIDWAVGAIKD